VRRQIADLTERTVDMYKIKFRDGINGMIRVVVGDIEFEAHPSVVNDSESLRSIIAAERQFKEQGV
jgi:hypothetical protein